ncbi:MAG: hypothetical protein NZ108_01890 [Bacteroidia bacterium]|nr:hypothetical protein [Bacteroidia bacterium]
MNLTTRFLNTLFLVAAIQLGGCKNSSSEQTKSVETPPKDTIQVIEQTTKTTEPTPVDRFWNDTARLLGGLPVESGSPWDSLLSKPEIKKHQEFFQRIWEKKEAGLLSKLRAWSPAEFPEEYKSNRTVFYPFSGPDFMTVYTLFPNATDYYMFGLENEGKIAVDKSLPIKKLAANLQNMQKSLDDIFGLTYFKTADMRVDLKIKELDGATPIILAFVARTGNDVLSVEPIKIDSTGQLVPYTEKIPQTPEDKVVTGTRIKFRNQKNQKEQTVTYFCANVIDEGMKNIPAFKTFLLNLKPTTTYIKSASYLMHNSYFSIIRNVVLDVSELLVQDDTGIPYRYFDAAKWNVTLYGAYLAPIELFRTRYQADLAAAFKDSTKVKKVDFGMGYTNSKNNFNLLAARKKK